jgi:hypothetical protein
MNRILVPLLVVLLAILIFGGNWWAARSASSCPKSTDPCKCVVTVSGLSAFEDADKAPSCSVKLSLGNFTASKLSNCDTVEPGWFDRIVMCDHNTEARLDCGGKVFTVSGGSATRFSCGKDQYDQPAIETSKDPWTSNTPQRRKPKFGGDDDDALRLVRRIFAGEEEEEPARDSMLTPFELVTVIDGDAGIESEGSARRVVVAEGKAVVEDFCQGAVTTVTGPALVRVATTPNYMALFTDPDPPSMDQLPKCKVEDLSGRWVGGYSRTLFSGDMDSVPIVIKLEGKEGTIELPDATVPIQKGDFFGGSFSVYAKSDTREIHLLGSAHKGSMEFSVTDTGTDEKGSKQYRSGQGSAQRLYIAHYGVAAAAVGTPYEFRLRAWSPGGGPLTWRVAEGELPTGIVLDAATGVLSGTPSAAGTVRFVAEVADESGAIFKQPFFFTVKKFLVNPAVLPEAIIGKPYSVKLEAAGGDPPYTWSMLLPLPGVRLDSTGELKTDAMPAATAIMAMVRDGKGKSELVMVSLPVRRLMILGSRVLPDAAAGKAYSYRFEAAAAGSVTWEWSPDLSGTGLEFNAQTGELSGTPARAGRLGLTVRAIGGDDSERRNFLLLITGEDGTMPAGAPCGACGRKR